MRPTLDAIARKVGVSKMAVSYALRGSAKVGEATRKRILEVAREMQYRPNASAKAIKSGRFDAVALLTDPTDWNSPASPGLLSGVQDVLGERGMHLMFERLSDDRLGDAESMPRILGELRVDGLLLNYHTRDAAGMVELVQRHGIPSVWLNRKRSSDAVYWDDRGAAQELTRRLAKLGHERIAYVDHRFHHNPPSDTRHYSKDERLAGYRAGMKEAKLRATVLLDGPDERWIDGWSEPVLSKLGAWAAAEAMPTAFITYGGETMSFLSHVLQADLGLRIPRDVSLASFADVPFAGVHTPHPTELALMVNEQAVLGRDAANMLMKKIARPGVKLPARALQYRFSKGATLARRRGGSR